MPVGVLILAAYSNDILKLGFKAAGLEKSSNLYVNVEEGIRSFTPGNMPWSHGLFMSVVWALLAGLIAFLIYHDRRSAIVVGSVVMSHWFLDFIVHPPELPLFFGSSRLYGLGLWSTATGFRFSVFLEVGMLAGGLAIYLIQRRKRSTVQVKGTGKPADHIDTQIPVPATAGESISNINDKSPSDLTEILEQAAEGEQDLKDEQGSGEEQASDNKQESRDERDSGDEQASRDDQDSDAKHDSKDEQESGEENDSGNKQDTRNEQVSGDEQDSADDQDSEDGQESIDGKVSGDKKDKGEK